MDLKTLENTPPWDWPEDTAEILLSSIRNGDLELRQRLTAIELAGDIVAMNDDVAAELLFIVGNGEAPEELRRLAAAALGPVLEYADIEEFEDPDAVPISQETFQRINKIFQQLYTDASVPEEVRRQVLEASVHAPQEWHPDAVRAAYHCNHEQWRLSAVFAMRFVRGFDEQILNALESPNAEIHYQAVVAAGNWQLEGAWQHLVRLLNGENTEKPLLLAAIEAAVNIHPAEVGLHLVDLADHEDEDIVDAAHEAMAFAEAEAGLVDFDDDEGIY